MSEQNKDVSQSPKQPDAASPESVPQPMASPVEGAPSDSAPVSQPSDASPESAPPAPIGQVPQQPADPSGAPSPSGDGKPAPQPAAPHPIADPAQAQPVPQPVPQPTPAPAPQPTGAAPAAQSQQPTPQPQQPAVQPAEAAAQPVPQPQQPTPQPVMPQPQQPGAYAPPAPQPPTGAKPKGTAALVLGILSIPLGILSPLVGVILGILAIVFAGRAIRATGRNGKTSGGRICGIVGIVVSVLSFIIALASGFITAAAVLDDPDPSYPADSSAVYAQEMTADEQACYDLGIQRLDALRNQDDAVIQSIVAQLDEGFAATFGASHADLGVDAQGLAKWMLSDFSYEPDGVYVDDEEGTATMYADIDLRDSYELLDNLYTISDDYLSSPEGEAMGAADAAAKLGEFYNKAMEETKDMTEYYAVIQFVRQGDGTWAIDEDAWSDEMTWMFGIY